MRFRIRNKTVGFSILTTAAVAGLGLLISMGVRSCEESEAQCARVISAADPPWQTFYRHLNNLPVDQQIDFARTFIGANAAALHGCRPLTADQVDVLVNVMQYDRKGEMTSLLVPYEDSLQAPNREAR